MDARALACLSALALVACSTVRGGGPLTEHMLVSSTGIAADGFIKAEHTCDGADEPPPLTWSGLPEEAGALAVTMLDTDADEFVHWVLYNVDPAANHDGLADITGASTTVNGFDRDGYGGPCPPPGDGPHEYRISVHALPGPIAESDDSRVVLASILESRIDGGTVIGLYDRAG